MKYELIKKILNSPITILDYLILEHIANNTAKEIIEDNISSKQQVKIDLGDKPNGMYFVKLQVGNDIVVKKIVVNK